MWTLTSPDGSLVERYIVEFECRVQNITFVEKYMSVNASGGTGRVATSVSCFGGLGQLYRALNTAGFHSGGEGRGELGMITRAG